ncbi:MAG TPA: PAS domain S-box protein [Cyclobacteriaceae bacterium]|nr:PAS domain S-box protein [Cyclobacteriaceae bacterium]
MVEDEVFEQLERKSTFLACSVVLVASLGLAGWWFGIEFLKHPIPGAATQNPLTAVQFIILVAAFFLLTPPSPSNNKLRFGSLLLLLPLSVGLYTLLDAFFHFPVHIDQILFREKLMLDAATRIPTRMALNTAVNFILSATSALMIGWAPSRAARHQVVNLIVALIATFVLLGYLYKVPEFYGVLYYIQMSPATATCFVLFAVALLLSTSNKGLMRELTGPYSGSLVARYLIPSAIVLPVLIGYLRLWGHWHKVFSVEMGVTIIVLSFMIVFVVAVWLSVTALNKKDTREKKTDIELSSLNDKLQTVNKDLAVLNQEFLASNEELLAGNEELTIINEKLEMANRTIAKQRDEQLNRVLDSSNDVIWSFDLTGNGENYLSRSAEKIYGEPLDKLIQRPQFWLEHLHPEDRTIKEASQRMLEAQGFTECTYRILLSGGTRWIHDRLKLIRSETGAPQRLDGIATDVTTIKEAQQELDRERNLLRSLIDNIPDYIFIRDDQFRSVINNKASIDLLGAANEAETLGKTAIDYFGEKGSPLMEDDQKVFTSGQPILNKEETVFINNQPRIILATKIPLKDDTGKTTMLIGIGRDITEFRKQEFVLNQHRENLDIIFSNSSGNFVLLDAKANVILFNQAFENFIFDIAGIKPLVGMQFIDAVAPHRREVAQALLNRALSGEKVSTEAEFTSRSGEKIHHLLRYESIIREGKVTHVSISAIDITERKEKENQLKESEANLESMLKAALVGFILLNRDYEVLMVNDSYRKMFRNVSGKDIVIGSSILDIVPPERTVSFKSMLDKVKTREIVEYEVNFEIESEIEWYKVTMTAVVTGHDEFLGYCVSVHDISAQKQAEASIRVSEERFRTLVEKSEDLSIISDFDGNVLFASANVPHILGYENITNGYGEFLHPNDKELSRERISLLKENPGKAYPLTFRIKHKDGSWRWMEGTSTNLSQLESIHGIVSTYRDVTVRKAMEEDLKGAASSLFEFQNAIYRSSIVSIADRRGDITFVNDNFVKISGYPREELIGQNHRIINSGYHHKSFWVDMWKTISNGEIWRKEVKNKAKDGSYYWVDTFVMPFLNEDGRIREFLSIRNDITERKKNVEELNRNQFFLEKASEAAKIGYWTSEPGVINGKLTWSKEVFNIFQLDEADFDGRIDTFYRFIHPEDRARVAEMSLSATAGDQVYDIDHRIVRLNGEVRWVNERAQVVRNGENEVLLMVGIIQDITERKTIEGVLREYNDRYEILSKATNDVIWDWDIVNDKVLYNHAMQTVLGYAELEIKSTRAWWDERFHPDDHERVLMEMESVFDKQLPTWDSVYRYHAAAGNYKHIHDRAYVVYGNAGQPIRMIGAMQDVTEQTMSLEEIKKLSLVASKTDNSVIITDSEGRIEWVNDGFTRLSGYTLDEVRGNYPQEFMEGPETDNNVAKRIRESLHGLEPVTEELLNYSKSGRKFWVRLSITPVLEGNNLKNFVTILSDISEQKEYEGSITSIARELANLIENANVPIFGVSEEGRITEWNRVCTELIGYSREEAFESKLLGTIVVPESWNRFNEMIIQVLAGVPVSNLEIPIISKSKKRIILLMSASPGRGLKEGVGGVIIVAQNVTELTEYRFGLEKKVEERTRELNHALQKEKELLEMKSKFVSIASHEFRTPLSSISLASGFIRKYKQRMTPDEVDTKLQNIEKQVHHMSYLLDDVLTVGKSDAGKIKVNWSTLRIRNLFDSLAQEVTQSTNDSHRITVQIDSVRESFLSDEKLMRSIIINLLTNAIKFSPGKDEVELTVSCNEIEMRILVRDFGMGIPPEDMDKLFESFYRGGNVTTISGTGLGLSIVKKAVDLLKGEVKMKSELGEGTEFCVSLPVKNE